MRILFDQGTPVPLRRALAGHEVDTVFELGWSSLSNGELLRQAESRYDLFVTTDRNLRYQQNLAGRKLSILVLPTTNWLVLRSRAQAIAAAAAVIKPGEYSELTPFSYWWRVATWTKPVSVAASWRCSPPSGRASSSPAR